MYITKWVNVRRIKIQQNHAWENAQLKCDTNKQLVLMKTNHAIDISSLSIGLFSFLITTNNNKLDCTILISLLPKGKFLQIASN